MVYIIWVFPRQKFNYVGKTSIGGLKTNSFLDFLTKMNCFSLPFIRHFSVFMLFLLQKSRCTASVLLYFVFPLTNEVNSQMKPKNAKSVVHVNQIQKHFVEQESWYALSEGKLTAVFFWLNSTVLAVRGKLAHVLTFSLNDTKLGIFNTTVLTSPY